MWNKQSAQGPAFAATLWRHKNDWARRSTKDGCSHAAKGARGEVCSDLRTHHDDRCLPLDSFPYDDVRGYSRAPFDHKPT
jgi:hypothetical protein